MGASKRELLLGDEAIALGAIHAGITAAYGYPGTPSTEILETLIEASHRETPFRAQWCTNEKTAYEQALGVSAAGRRAIVTMKHVGLNVAADSFMSSALISINGGMVLAVADDPGMHSSQNEQDSRYYADFAKVLCLEPANHQEAYDMTREAFELSERHHMPVVLRIVTRLAHSRGIVEAKAPRKQNSLNKASNPKQWILLPANARNQWHQRLVSEKLLHQECEHSTFNPLRLAPKQHELGVITTGLARNYFEEVQSELSTSVSHLHIGQYPMPLEKIRALTKHVKHVLLLEEGYPHVEKLLRGIIPPEVAIAGRMSGEVPSDGELTPDLVRKALGLETAASLSKAASMTVPGRPPQLCPGCPHVDSFGALKEALTSLGFQGQPSKIITGDIGCSTLGAMPEYQAIETCVCMGASIGLAKGAADAGLHPAIAIIGDSTFFHSGMTALLDAIASNTNMTVLILDNQTTAMTGGQPTIVKSPRIKDVVLGLGVAPEHCHVVTTHRTKVAEVSDMIRKEIGYPGLSVIIAVRECIETAKRHARERTAAASKEEQNS